ncbi:MAG: AAA family ATPase [Actinomycetota bacterium]|nr:AAA family ATPase [Actinomycetota bacterium]
MQQRTDAQARAAGLQLRIRIGVSIGDAVEDEGDWFGPAVVEAARLCDLAAPGEILATRMLRELAAPGTDVTFELVGPRSLKGIPDPVEVHSVQWPPAPDGALEPPAMLTGHGAFEMVGRDAERALILDAWEATGQGTRRVVLLGGEPGVGKSRLTADLAARVHAYGGQVLLGRCDPEGGGPFQPFVIALRQHLEECTARNESPDLGPNAGTLTRLVPELPGAEGQAAASSDPAEERLALFDAIADAFHRIADRAPLLLVLEDLHWAAAETIQLLRHLIGWTHDASMLVIVTVRTTEVDGESGLGQFLAESARLVRSQRIDLHGLAEHDIVGLLAGGCEPTDDVVSLARTLHEQTDGNALYTTQLLAHAIETGMVERARRRPAHDRRQPGGAAAAGVAA